MDTFEIPDSFLYEDDDELDIVYPQMFLFPAVLPRSIEELLARTEQTGLAVMKGVAGFVFLSYAYQGASLVAENLLISQSKEKLKESAQKAELFIESIDDFIKENRAYISKEDLNELIKIKQKLKKILKAKTADLFQVRQTLKMSEQKLDAIYFKVFATRKEKGEIQGKPKKHFMETTSALLSPFQS